MQCNCGGITETTHKVVRKGELQGEYEKCPSCGRICWLWKSEELDMEIESSITNDALCEIDKNA